MAIGTISNSEAGLSCRTKLNQALSLWDGMAGVIMAFGGSSAPSKWTLCNGSAISRSTYSELFSIVGTSYGMGDGTTTFNLPDLRGRTPVGVNEATFSALGTNIGEETHTLTEAELPIVAGHIHSVGESVSAQSGTDYNIFATYGTNLSTQVGGGFGSGTAHNNIQPSLCVNYIIYTGV